MTNALFKSARDLIVLPDPVPPAPPPGRRLVRRQGRRPKYAYTEYIVISVSSSGKIQYQGVEATKVLIGYEVYDYFEWVEDVVVVPPVKTPVVTEIPDAWDATARSGVVATDPMVVEWTVGRGNVDMVIGMCTAVEDVSTATLTNAAAESARAAALRSTVLHGFRINGGSAHVHSAAPPGFSTAGLDIRYPAVELTNGSVCRIELARGKITYILDNLIIATGPAFVHPGQAVYLRAVFYGKGDSLDAPLLEPLGNIGEASIKLAPLTVKAGRFSEGRAMLGPLSVQSERFNPTAMLGPLWLRGRSAEGGGAANILLAPLTAGGWGLQLSVGNAAFDLAPLTAKGAQTRYADAVAKIGFLWVQARGREIDPQNNAIVGVQSRVDAQPAPGLYSGAYGVAGMDVRFEAQLYSPRTLRARVNLRTRARMARVWAGALRSAAGIRSRLQGQRVYDVVLLTKPGIDAELLGVLIVSAELDASITARATFGDTRVADAALRAQLAARVGTDVMGMYAAAFRALVKAGLTGVRDPSDYLVWSIEQGGASAGYANFAFNSFARIGDRIFAASDDGLYELTGQTDAGEPIPAKVDLGQRNFGTTRLKGISNAYLTASSTSKLLVIVTTPCGKKYVYRARASDRNMEAQRADFGRGLSATYLNLELSNGGDGDFDIERLEFVVKESNRRI